MEPLRIRSYRVVFRLERRLHRIGNWRVPLPHGLPLAGACYFALALCLVLILGRIPLVGALLGVLPAPARLAVLPAAAALALLRWRPDGRPPPRALLALARHRLGAQRLAAFRSAPLGVVRLADLHLAPGSGGTRLRRAVLRGRAGGVGATLRYPCAISGRGRVLRALQTGEGPVQEGREIAVGRGRRAVLGR